MSLRIVDGKTTSLWFDPWFKGGSLMNRLGLNVAQRTRTERYIVENIMDDKCWKRESFSFLFQINSEICEILIYNDNDKDYWIWSTSTKGRYNFKEIWNFIRTKYESKTRAKIVWEKIHVPKIAACHYRVLNNFLTTKDRLIHRRILIDPMCLLCNKQEETVEHLFFQCEFSKEIWSWCLANMFSNYSHRPSFNLKEIYELVLNQSKKKCFQTDLVLLAFSTSTWAIWKERNNRVFRSQSMNVKSVCNIITQTIKIRISKSKFLKNPNPNQTELIRKWVGDFTSHCCCGLHPD